LKWKHTTLIFIVAKLFLAFFVPFAVLIAWLEITIPIETNIAWWILKTMGLSAAIIWFAVKVNSFDDLDGVKKTTLVKFWNSLEPLSKKAIVVSIAISLILILII